MIKSIQHQGKELALLIRSEFHPAETEFFTPDHYKQQVGFVVYPAGGAIHAHSHQNTERHIFGMSELLVVREGRCYVDLYDDNQNPVTTVELKKGDILLLVQGGHGLRMIERTVFLEVKQGPFAGPHEKVLFNKVDQVSEKLAKQVEPCPG